MSATTTEPLTSEQQAHADFPGDVAGHQMRVLLDDGQHRHLSFATPGTRVAHFDLLTAPDTLTIRSDRGTYVFARPRTDMLWFFAAGPGINLAYWGEKLEAHSGYRAYAAHNLHEQVNEAVAEYLDELDDDEADAIREELLESVKDDVLLFDDEELEAHAALERFNGHGLRFADTWEWDLTDFEYQYVWCALAIRWGVELYRVATSLPGPTS